ncbi:MAG: hypothetical protein WBQ75_15080 [Acetobacteraceae bacterium]
MLVLPHTTFAAPHDWAASPSLANLPSPFVVVGTVLDAFVAAVFVSVAVVLGAAAGVAVWPAEDSAVLVVDEWRRRWLVVLGCVVVVSAVVAAGVAAAPVWLVAASDEARRWRRWVVLGVGVVVGCVVAEPAVVVSVVPVAASVAPPLSSSTITGKAI